MEAARTKPIQLGFKDDVVVVVMKVCSLKKQRRINPNFQLPASLQNPQIKISYVNAPS